MELSHLYSDIYLPNFHTLHKSNFLTFIFHALDDQTSLSGTFSLKMLAVNDLPISLCKSSSMLSLKCSCSQRPQLNSSIWIQGQMGFSETLLRLPFQITYFHPLRIIASDVIQVSSMAPLALLVL